MKRAVGLAALTVLELPHEEQVSVAAQAGYSHVGLRLVPVAGQPYNHPFDVVQVEKRLADTGVSVLDVEVFRLTPQTNIKEFEAVMATAQRLGATELLVHGADSDEARLIESFGRLCDLAAGYGLSANLEPMPWVDVSTVAKARRIVDAARGNSAGSAVSLTTQGIFPVTGWTTRNPDEKIVPAREHTRLTDRKSTDAAQADPLPPDKCAYGRSKDEGE